jgi:hypothetical protein
MCALRSWATVNMHGARKLYSKNAYIIPFELPPISQKVINIRDRKLLPRRDIGRARRSGMNKKGSTEYTHFCPDDQICLYKGDLDFLMHNKLSSERKLSNMYTLPCSLPHVSGHEVLHHTELQRWQLTQELTLRTVCLHTVWMPTAHRVSVIQARPCSHSW